jgi:ATP-dependent helicase/nuclease subunit A
MSTLRLTDAAARDRMREDLDSTLIVEAGAGSGKTTVLIDRILATLLAGKCEMQEIAAVTFTRKAAAELRERLQIGLEREAGLNVSAAAIKGLVEFDRAFVGTIHAFCARLLRERPVEANLDPDFEEIEGAEEGLLIDEAWDEFLMKFVHSGSGLAAKLEETGLILRDLKHDYTKLIGYPEVQYDVLATAKPDVDPARKALGRLVTQVFPLIPTDEPEDGWDAAQSMIRKARRIADYIGKGTDTQFMELLSGFDKDLGLIQKRWTTPENGKKAKDLIQAFREKFAIHTIRAWREYRYQYALQFIKEATAFCHERRRKQSRLNFQDLLMLTASMLRENPEVRRHFQAKYTRIFVDEFQDTDPIQAEILFLLTGTDVYQRDWQKLVPRHGSLFIVGDPKQSIYRFRRADISTYNGVKRKLKAVSRDSEVSLTSNFRSDPSITQSLNNVFRQVFPAAETEYQAKFEPLESPYAALPGEHTGVRKIVLRGLGKTVAKRQVAEADAEIIAQFISIALDGGVKIKRAPAEKGPALSESARPSDFLILLYRKQHLDAYAKALESYDIPYEISGGHGFSESEELKALQDLLLYINDPADQIQLFKSLRGRLFGVSDDLFYRYKQEGGYLSIFTPEKKYKDREINVVLQPALVRLRTYWEWSRKYVPSVTLEKICNDLGLLAFAASGELAGSSTGNILKALELVRSSFEVNSFASMVDYFGVLLESEDVEEFSAKGDQSDAVRLMNLHKAKGLEAPIVFLANPISYVKKPFYHHVERKEGVARGFFAATKDKGEYQREILAQPPDWEAYEQAEKQFKQGEEDRLLYVAATRAKQLLVISVNEDKPQASPWCSFVEKLRDVPELKFKHTKSAKAVKAEKIDLGGLQDALEKVKKEIRQAEGHSYETMSVTALAHKDGVIPAWIDSGRGLAWGRVVHRVLQACAPTLPAGLPLIIENTLVEEGLPAEQRDGVLALVKSITTSGLWTRMNTAEKRYTEMPFSLRAKNADLGLESGGLPVVVSGTIDLLFREADGWVIVDYKTDEIKDNLQSLVEYYRKQLDLYAEFWQKITGDRVKERILFFVSTGDLIQV